MKPMRDALIEKIYARMAVEDSMFFVSADFGAPALDRIRADFPDRFINVGIAEQNLVNIAAGLALEGAIVYAYAIAPFLSMRAYEQIRTNLAMMCQIRPINVNLISVGAGLSYDVTGPTHHCLEDLSIMRALPNLILFSPADDVTATAFVDYSITIRKPKYIRLDGKALPRIYSDTREISLEAGFAELKRGEDVCIVSTGYMTHKALKIADNLRDKGIEAGVLDVFMLKPINEEHLFTTLAHYPHIFTLEEGFVGRGGLDSMINEIARRNAFPFTVATFGFGPGYVFSVGDREYLHHVNGLDAENIVRIIEKVLQEKRLKTVRAWK